MTKEEVMALGIPAEKYREFQVLYNRDLNQRAGSKVEMEDADWKTRSAIHAMLKLIKRPETLHSILVYVNSAYFKEV